jgi:hypothetical protein
MSTLKVITAVHPSSATNNLVLDSSGNVTVGNNITATGTITGAGTLTTTGTVVMGSSFLRNRIINGDMRIDQRNVGAAVTTPTDGQYIVDRFLVSVSVSGKMSVGQNYNSVTPPAGFPNYLGAASISAYSVGSTDLFSYQHRIEGYNVSDLAWGSASAKSVTLSFYVYSSLTGTFGGAVQNSAQNRSYPFTYTISSANTWEQKTITIPGDTSGTWLTTNGIGINLYWTIGAGTGRQGAAGSWAGSNYQAASGATSILGTNGATLYITGVQLEVGSVATPFERRQYGQELALCQRYYYQTANTGEPSWWGYGSAGGQAMGNSYKHPVQMRASPNGAISGTFLTQNVGQPSVIATGSTGYTLYATTTTGGSNWFQPNSSAVVSMSVEL